MSDSWGKWLTDGASTAQNTWCTLGHVAGVLETAYHNLPRAQPLDDKDLLILLSKCAEDCYDFSLKDDLSTWVELTKRSSVGVGYFLYGFYRVKRGSHNGKTILAVQGTQAHRNIASVIQDVEIGKMVLQSAESSEATPGITTAIEKGVSVAELLKPDYICGHSLGGFIAEIIASKLSIEGASFNCPGPYSSNEERNLCGSKFRDLRFEVILTRLDPVSQVCLDKVRTPMNSHIGTPRFLEGKNVAGEKLERTQ